MDHRVTRVRTYIVVCRSLTLFHRCSCCKHQGQLPHCQQSRLYRAQLLKHRHRVRVCFGALCALIATGCVCMSHSALCPGILQVHHVQLKCCAVKESSVALLSCYLCSDDSSKSRDHLSHCSVAISAAMTPASQGVICRIAQLLSL